MLLLWLGVNLKENQSWIISDVKKFPQIQGFRAIVRKCKPGHVFNMSPEFLISTIRTHIDYFNFLIEGIHLMIKGGEVISSKGRCTLQMKGSKVEANEVTCLI
jgi:hypothetical protein